MKFKKISLILATYLPVFFLILSFFQKGAKGLTLDLFWLSLLTSFFIVLISFKNKFHWLSLPISGILLMILAPFSIPLWKIGPFIFPFVLVIYSIILQAIASKMLFKEKQKKTLYRFIYLIATILLPIFMLSWLVIATIEALD